jgi:hypothetical protein
MIKFVVGFAGSGKSTELASRATKKTLVMTPTHKAAGVLIKKGILNVYTIHSVLKLVPTIDQNFRKGQKIQKLRKVGDTDLKEISDIFIDEFSMINREILDLLLAIVPDKCNVTIFGDPYQLPPVTGKAIKPKKYSKDIHELTTQHRSDSPEVVDTFMKFVKYIKGGCKGPAPRVDLPHGSLNDFNPITDRALGFTNNTVIGMNKNVFDQGKFTGEIIINNMDCRLDCGKGSRIYPKMLVRGHVVYDESKVDEIEYNIEKFNTELSSYKLINVDVDGEIYEIYSDKNHYENSVQFRKDVEKYQNLVITENGLDDDVDLPYWCRNNRGAPYVKERGRAWSKYMAHKDLVFDVRFAFATTVHKSQGQEFDRVYLNMSDISKCKDKELYARLVYVGLSRAIKEVRVL